MPTAMQQPSRFGAAPRTTPTPSWPDTAILVTATVLTLLSMVLMLVLLRQRDSAHPWARLDVYSGGFLVVAGVAGIVQITTFLRSALRSDAGAGEAFGLSYDPGIVLDYGHWHLVPALEQPVLQTLGLVFAALGSAGLIWTDRWLSRHFASGAAAGQMMTDGPYRFVRHPRYASILLIGLGTPLAFASILGWPLVLVLLVAIRHRIEREEPHLRELFGSAYAAYARRTARLLPGVY